MHCRVVFPFVASFFLVSFCRFVVPLRLFFGSYDIILNLLADTANTDA